MGNSVGFFGITSAMAMRRTATPNKAVNPIVTRSLRSCDANVGENTPEHGIVSAKIYPDEASMASTTFNRSGWIGKISLIFLEAGFQLVFTTNQ
jgi:hypothetical protein